MLRGLRGVRRVGTRKAGIRRGMERQQEGRVRFNMNRVTEVVFSVLRITYQIGTRYLVSLIGITTVSLTTWQVPGTAHHISHTWLASQVKYRSFITDHLSR